MKTLLLKEIMLVTSIFSFPTKFSIPLLFPKQQILDSSKLKEVADDNFKFDQTGRKLSKRVENTVKKKGKLLVTSNFSFSHSVFKRPVLKTPKNQGLFGNGLKTKIISW